MPTLISQVVVITKDSALGGNNLTAEIQRQLNLSYVDAETLKTGGHGNGMPLNFHNQGGDVGRVLAGIVVAPEQHVDFARFLAVACGPYARALVRGHGP